MASFAVSRCHAPYVKQYGERRLFLLLYVDDMLLASDDMGLLEETKGMLSSVFKMTDPILATTWGFMGAVTYYLGFHVSGLRKKVKYRMFCY